MNMDKETRTNLKKAILFFSLTAGMLFLIFRFGLLTAVKISEFLQKDNVGTEEIPLENYLSAPQVETVPKATNTSDLSVSGFGPANKEVVLFLNEIEDQSVSVDSEGKFSTSLILALGVNNIYAVVRDFEGNLSAKSNIQTVYYSNIPPFIDIQDPQPESVIKNNPDIVIRGRTDASAKVYINDHLILVDSEGNFSYPTKLVKGKNNFKIVSIDPAQNLTEKEFSFEFRP